MLKSKMIYLGFWVTNKNFIHYFELFESVNVEGDILINYIKLIPL